MSKKLNGNGRWESSRMMLPEHREQLLEGNVARPAAPAVVTQEELGLIRDYILLPIILSIAESNRQRIENTTHTLRPLYVKATLILLDMVHRDLTEIRKEMRRQSIKVYEEEQTGTTVRYRFNIRGYEDVFTMLREYMIAEASVRISKYIKRVFTS